MAPPTDNLVAVTEDEEEEYFVTEYVSETDDVIVYEYEGPQPRVGDNEQYFMLDDACGKFEIKDCDDNCAPAYWIANGLCDNGKGDDGGVFTYMVGIFTGGKNKKLYNFDCEKFHHDGGDCKTPGK